MTVYCPNCLQKARIRSRTNMNDERAVAELYCQCQNVPECGATFVYTLAFKHYLNPPVTSTGQLAANVLEDSSQE